MKTKIRSLIIICTLGIVGMLSANAALSYKTSYAAETLEEQNIAKSANSNSAEFVFIEDADAAVNYQMEAQLITKSIADNEEAKTIQMLIDKGIFLSNDENDSFASEAKSENLNSSEFIFTTEFDYQKEAQLVTKWVADNEEARTIQMLIDRGIFVSNEEVSFFSDDAKPENVNSADCFLNDGTESKIDFQKEAQLITKRIADNEETKTIQKLIDEGKLAENK